MKSKPKERFSLDEIARRLESLKTKNADGTFSFSGFEFEDIEIVLRTSIQWNDALSSVEQRTIAFHAAFKAAATGTITKSSLLAAIHSLESKTLAKPTTAYWVISTLSVQYGDFLRPVSLDGSRFSFHPRLPKHIDRKAIEQNIESPNLGPSLPAGYVVVRGKVNARSPDAAVSRALLSLDILRGIWNFTINWAVFSKFSFGGGRWEPVNKVRPGPISTVHLPDGKLAAEHWWYEPNFIHSDPEDLKRDWIRVVKNAPWCVKQWKLIPYKKDADAFWVRYARALDRADHEANFLRLWSLLELLTGTSGERYDETIKRTLFVCREREFNRLILEHLRDQRNALVHRDESTGEVDRHLFQLKGYVEDLIRLHLAWAGKFQSLSEFGEFLSLPEAPGVLKERIRLFQRGHRFRVGTLSA